MTTRHRCLVPFCPRTRGDRKNDPVARYDEWLCGDHWPRVDLRLRRLHRRAQRLGRPAVAHWLWDRCKGQALARALP